MISIHRICQIPTNCQPSPEKFWFARVRLYPLSGYRAARKYFWINSPGPKKKTNSNHVNKWKNVQILNFCRTNGRIIRPTGFFFCETFRANSSSGFEGLETFFWKIIFSFFSLLFIFSFILPFIFSSSCLSSSSCLASSLFLSSLFSSLVSNFLFHIHVSLLFSFISSFLLFHLPVSSLLLSRLLLSCLVLSCLVLSCLSFSVSFSVSVWCCVLWCCVVCGVCVCCVVLCVVCCVVLCLCCVVLCCVVCVVCGAAWHAEKTSVCRFKTSPCVPAPRAHVLPHAGVVPVHTGTFWIYTRRFLRRTHGGRGGGGGERGRGQAGHRQFC